MLSVIGVTLGQVAQGFLETYYLAEDGILEWMTVGVLFLLAGLCLYRAGRLRRLRSRLFPVSLIVMALMFLFVAGEELSWGQRIFGIDTPPWMEERNQQGEMNLHNLVSGEMSINKVIFGQVLGLALVIYMFLLPWAASRFARVARLADQLGLALPRRAQALAFFPVAFLPAMLLDADQADELVEICGVLMLLAIFLYPRNPALFSPARDLRGA